MGSGDFSKHTLGTLHLFPGHTDWKVDKTWCRQTNKSSQRVKQGSFMQWENPADRATMSPHELIQTACFA